MSTMIITESAGQKPEQRVSRRPRHRILLAAIVSATAIATPLIGATSSAHALSDNADCVAKVVHVEGTPGETQRVLHLPEFGLLISLVAHVPSEECVF